MKILKLIAFVATFAILFAGCEKDDEFSIVGTWNVDKLKISNSGELITETSAAGTLTFNTDESGTFELVGYSGIGDFTWSLTGNILVISGIGEGVDGNYTLVEKEDDFVVIQKLILTYETLIELSRIE